MTHNHSNCSTMACPKYCAEWIADWKRHAPHTFKSRLQRTYLEQRSNCEASKNYGHGWLNSDGLSIETYETSVKMLETELWNMTYPG